MRKCKKRKKRKYNENINIFYYKLFILNPLLTIIQKIKKRMPFFKETILFLLLDLTIFSNEIKIEMMNIF